MMQSNHVPHRPAAVCRDCNRRASWPPPSLTYAGTLGVVERYE
jgi:hypothetical protein